MSDTDADKKRNKLGYQRISVACGHCRRRKIRCVMAEGDAQNRCQNCIRLQKQCVFYPVDQPLPPSDKAGPSRSGSSTVLSTTQGQSPPDMSSSFDPRFPAVVPVPSNVPQGYPTYDAPVQGNEMYRQPDYMGQWSQADANANAQVAMDTSYLQGGTMVYSPFAGAGSIHSTPTDTRSYSFPAPEDTRQWQQAYAAGRAMSFGNLDNMQTTYAHPAPVYAGVPIQQVGQGYPLQLDMQSAQLHQMPGPQSAPAGMPMPQYMTPTTPQGFPAQGAWYGGQNYEQYGSGDTDNTRRTQR